MSGEARLASGFDSTRTAAGLQCEKVHALASFVIGDFEFAGYIGAHRISSPALLTHNATYGYQALPVER